MKNAINTTAVKKSADLNSDVIKLIHDHGQAMKPTAAFGGCMTSVHELNGVEVMEYVDFNDNVAIYAVVPAGTAEAFENAVLDTCNMEYRTADAHRFFVENGWRFKWVDINGDVVDIASLKVA